MPLRHDCLIYLKKRILPASSEERRCGGVVRECCEAHATHAGSCREPLEHAQQALAQPTAPPALLDLHLVTDDEGKQNLQLFSSLILYYIRITTM